MPSRIFRGDARLYRPVFPTFAFEVLVLLTLSSSPRRLISNMYKDQDHMKDSISPKLPFIMPASA